MIQRYVAERRKIFIFAVAVGVRIGITTKIFWINSHCFDLPNVLGTSASVGPSEGGLPNTFDFNGSQVTFPHIEIEPEPLVLLFIDFQYRVVSRNAVIGLLCKMTKL